MFENGVQKDINNVVRGSLRPVTFTILWENQQNKQTLYASLWLCAYVEGVFLILGKWLF